MDIFNRYMACYCSMKKPLEKRAVENLLKEEENFCNNEKNGNTGSDESLQHSVPSDTEETPLSAAFQAILSDKTENVDRQIGSWKTCASSSPYFPVHEKQCISIYESWPLFAELQNNMKTSTKKDDNSSEKKSMACTLNTRVRASSDSKLGALSLRYSNKHFSPVKYTFRHYQNTTEYIRKYREAITIPRLERHAERLKEAEVRSFSASHPDKLRYPFVKAETESKVIPRERTQTVPNSTFKKNFGSRINKACFGALMINGLTPPCSEYKEFWRNRQENINQEKKVTNTVYYKQGQQLSRTKDTIVDSSEDELFCPLEKLQTKNLPRLQYSYNTADFRLPTCKLVVAPLTHTDAFSAGKRREKPKKIPKREKSQTYVPKSDPIDISKYTSLDNCITDYVKVQKLRPRNNTR